MKKELLSKCIRKYCVIELEKTSSPNVNFDKLLEFIGEYKDYGKNTKICNAYCAIKERTNKLLHVGWCSRYTLKTSSKEIAAIRQAFDQKRLFVRTGRYIIKIPYKVDDIFKAIITLVAEIKKENSISIPQNLHEVLNICYGQAFYAQQISKYSRVYNMELRRIMNEAVVDCDTQCVLALNDIFGAENSPLNVMVGKEVIFDA